MGAGVITGTISCLMGTNRLRAELNMREKRVFARAQSIWYNESRDFLSLSNRMEEVAMMKLRGLNRRNNDDYIYVRVWELQNFTPTNRVMTESDVIAGDGGTIRRTRANVRLSAVPPVDFFDRGAEDIHSNLENHINQEALRRLVDTAGGWVPGPEYAARFYPGADGPITWTEVPEDETGPF